LIKLSGEYILQEFIDTIKVDLFAFTDNQHASCTEYHKGYFACFQTILALNTRVTTRVITTFDTLVFQNNKQLLAVDVIIAAEI
jgi:hypothetical protein